MMVLDVCSPAGSDKKTIEKHTAIIHSNLETIETCGGGSARCMMAEVFNPVAND